MREAVVFDIDGVLADTLHLIRALDPANPDWVAFHLGCNEAPAIAGNLALLRMLYESGYYTVLLSHRPEAYLAGTTSWLARNSTPYDHLIMRPPGEYVGWKVGQVLRLAERYTVRLVVDDDPTIRDEVTEAGFPCLYIHSGHHEVQQDVAAYVAQDRGVPG